MFNDDEGRSVPVIASQCVCSMDFSDSIPCTAAPVFSPDQNFFATAHDYRLTVRHCESLAIAQVFCCLDRRAPEGPTTELMSRYGPCV